MKNNIGLRIIVTIIGLLILAHGIAFAINSNLGITPVHSTAYTIYFLNRFTVGTNVMFFFIFLVFLQMLVLGKKFKFWEFYQVPLAVLFGYFVDFALWNLHWINVNTYFGQLFLLCFSIIFMPLGIVTYLHPNLIKMPPEGTVLAFVERFGVPFHKVKLSFDMSITITAVILSLIFIRSIYSVREGTVILALTIGRLIPHMKKLVNFTFGKLKIEF